MTYDHPMHQEPQFPAEVSRPNPDCAAKDRPHLAHTLNGPGGNKPGSRCAGVSEVDEFDRHMAEAEGHLAEVERIEAAARPAGEGDLRARPTALAAEWEALDMGTGLYPEDSAHRQAHEDRAEACADELRAALAALPTTGSDQ